MNRTLQRGIEVLELVSAERNGKTLNEISKELNIPKSSAFDIVQTLYSLKMLEVNRYNEKKYILGSKSFILGMRHLSNTFLIDCCTNYLSSLANELHCNAFVGYLDENEIVYLQKIVGTSTKAATNNIGNRVGLYYSSLGKAILAFLPTSQQLKLVDEIVFTAKTDRTIITKDGLMQDLRRTRARGYSIDDRECEEYVFCFGAPIFDYLGNVIAAISISFVYNKDIQISKFGQLIQNTAMIITKKLAELGAKS